MGNYGKFFMHGLILFFLLRSLISHNFPQFLSNKKAKSYNFFPNNKRMNYNKRMNFSPD